MSKTWKVPAGMEQRIVRRIADHGLRVEAGATIAEMQLVRFQGVEAPGDMSTLPVKAPVAGRLLYWPGTQEGAVVRDGQKVFSVLSEQDWDDLGQTAGDTVRDAMRQWPPGVSAAEFETAMEAMTAAGVKRFLGL